MIGFADFVPTVVQEGGLLRPEERAPVQEAVDRANEWIARHGVRALNLETVVMPNIFVPGEQGPQDASVGVWGDMPHRWYPFIRVWYTYAEASP
jgi:hypothetical protein